MLFFSSWTSISFHMITLFCVLIPKENEHRMASHMWARHITQSCTRFSSLFPKEAEWCQHSQRLQRKAKKSQGSCKKELPVRITVNRDSLVFRCLHLSTSLPAFVNIWAGASWGAEWEKQPEVTGSTAWEVPTSYRWPQLWAFLAASLFICTFHPLKPNTFYSTT